MASHVQMAGRGRSWLLAATAALASATAAPAGAGLEQRPHDPVVVPGARLVALAARETARLRLYRVERGEMVPIPFQLDARDERGDLVVDGPIDFVLDDGDELVFMARDAGERGSPELLPQGCTEALEIEVIEPGVGPRAWAYLAAFPTPPPPEPFEPYVVYDWSARRARSPTYNVEYALARNYFTGIRVLEPAGGNGANLLRQSRMRGSPTFSLFLTDLTLDFTEQSSVVEIEGVRAGPVRAARRVRLSVELGPLFPELPSGVATTVHYRSAYLTESRVRFPWIMLQTLRDFRFENVLDFERDALPLRYFDPGYPDGIPLEPETPLEIATSDDRGWWVHSGSTGTMLHAFVIPRRWREWGVVRGTVIRSADRREAVDAPFAAGFTLRNMTSLREAGAYDLMMASVVLPGPYRPGDEVPALAMLEAPLAVEVRRVR
jgi:hypothetical protein